MVRSIRGVELARVGSWEISTGKWDVTAGQLAHAVTASQSAPRPIIKLGHVDPRFDGEPAVGWIDNLRTDLDGTSLVGDFVGVPAWLADVMASAYPQRSIEGAYRVDENGRATDEFILEAVALLGVTPPGIKGLRPIEGPIHDVAALYGLAASGRVRVAASAPPREAPADIRRRVMVRAAATRRRIRRAQTVLANLEGV